MSSITFADVVHQAIKLDQSDEAEALVLRLVDTPWMQRLRDISQTANSRLVYMFSEHSRFGHSIGVAYLAIETMRSLARRFPEQVAKYKSAVAAAALLHDIGHLAPGSHTAFKTWFPKLPDTHEEIAMRILSEPGEIREILAAVRPSLPAEVESILLESADVPPWTWEIISGGGWNVDRGNWCIVDSILAGVSYGKYNIPALTDAIVITADGHLALEENRIDAMMHFAISRHAMYRQVYQHRVLLSADTINRSIAQRARDLADRVPFADDVMQQVLAADSPEDLELGTIFHMREPWWKYHLLRWSESDDEVLADLSDRLLHRRLFKTIRVTEFNLEIVSKAHEVARAHGYDPRYYVHEISTDDVYSGEQRQSMLIQRDDGSVVSLLDAEPLFQTLVRDARIWKRRWVALPSDVKDELGVSR